MSGPCCVGHGSSLALVSNERARELVSKESEGDGARDLIVVSQNADRLLQPYAEEVAGRLEAALGSCRATGADLGSFCFDVGAGRTICAAGGGDLLSCTHSKLNACLHLARSRALWLARALPPPSSLSSPISVFFSRGRHSKSYADDFMKHGRGNPKP